MSGTVARTATALLLSACALAFAQTKAAAVPDTLARRLLACAACHGEKGEGLNLKNEYFPRLAGKPAGYLYNQLINFRDKRRSAAVMNYMVAYLSDAYLFEIANHYAALRRLSRKLISWL